MSHWGRGHKGRVTSGLIDSRLLGLGKSEIDLLVKPHCPNCGYVYRDSKADEKRGRLCGTCERYPERDVVEANRLGHLRPEDRTAAVQPDREEVNNDGGDEG